MDSIKGPMSFIGTTGVKGNGILPSSTQSIRQIRIRLEDTESSTPDRPAPPRAIRMPSSPASNNELLLVTSALKVAIQDEYRALTILEFVHGLEEVVPQPAPIKFDQATFWQPLIDIPILVQFYYLDRFLAENFQHEARLSTDAERRHCLARFDTHMQEQYAIEIQKYESEDVRRHKSAMEALIEAENKWSLVWDATQPWRNPGRPSAAQKQRYQQEEDTKKGLFQSIRSEAIQTLPENVVSQSHGMHSSAKPTSFSTSDHAASNPGNGQDTSTQVFGKPSSRGHATPASFNDPFPSDPSFVPSSNDNAMSNNTQLQESEAGNYQGRGNFAGFPTNKSSSIIRQMPNNNVEHTGNGFSSKESYVCPTPQQVLLEGRTLETVAKEFEKEKPWVISENVGDSSIYNTPNGWRAEDWPDYQNFIDDYRKPFGG